MYYINSSGSSALSYSLDPKPDWQLEHIALHLGAASTGGILYVTLDSVNGAAYDTAILTQNTSTEFTDLFYQPDRRIAFDAGDIVKIVWTNPSTCAYGLTIAYSVL